MHQVVEPEHVDDNVSRQPMSFSMTQMNSLKHVQIPHTVYEGPSGQAFCKEPGGQAQVGVVCFAVCCPLPLFVHLLEISIIYPFLHSSVIAWINKYLTIYDQICVIFI